MHTHAKCSLPTLLLALVTPLLALDNFMVPFPANLPQQPNGKGFTCTSPSLGLPKDAIQNFIGFLKTHTDARNNPCYYSGSTCQQITTWVEEAFTTTLSICGMGYPTIPGGHQDHHAVPCPQLIPALDALQGNCSTNEWAVAGGQVSLGLTQQDLVDGFGPGQLGPDGVKAENDDSDDVLRTQFIALGRS